MAKVEVYTTDYCPYCVRAKQLLDVKDVDYTEIDVTNDDGARVALVQKAQGRRTVPQIFINDKAVGGYDDLRALEEAGELDKMLAE
ncbi:MAG TPA: glutaredoxin 3 [Alphaproteobacteria bacterium]|nr:glutaredoxin 3 [Alphaproteobacteria bacterium]HNS44565.1 glutaredoxin 3 [Alphaproteobacteria bacterium]